MPIDADGLKTGHTEIAGYGLTASAKRAERRLILVVNGLSSTRERAQETQQLLDWGFRTFENRDLFDKGEVVEHAEVWLGEADTVPLAIDRDLHLTIPRQPSDEFRVSVVYDGPIPAPIQKGQQLATLVVEGPDMERQTVPLIAGEDVPKLGFVGRMGAAAKHLVFGAARRAIGAAAPSAPSTEQ